MNSPWLVSARFDLGLIIGPPLTAVLLVLGVPALQDAETTVWGWVLVVVFIDVAHVYASLYRTYFDSEEFTRRKNLYVYTPMFVFLGGVALYSLGALVFWRVLAYVAVYHFVRQQFGFVMVYRHRGGERGKWDARLDKCTIYSTMLYPLAFWHSEPSSRTFEWFVKGDFITLPEWVATAAVGFYTATLLLFFCRQVQVFITERKVNWGKTGVVVSTAAVWYFGIVYLNSDFAFTITNIVAHGVPYMAIVWIYGHRKWTPEKKSWLSTIHRPMWALAFLGLLMLLAYTEEGLWDVFVWKEHAAVFGGLNLGRELPSMALIILVPLLTVPQATHYILDAYIWKFDGSNPGLRYYLFHEGSPPGEDGGIE